MSDWKHFIALFLLGSIALSSIALFVGFADYDYHYTYEREVDHFPPRVYPTDYSALQPESQQVVDEALETGRVTRQNGSAIPSVKKSSLPSEGSTETNFGSRLYVNESNLSEIASEGIKRDGRKYLFTASRSFDWTDPRTFGPMLLGLLCGGGVLATIRSSIKDSMVR
ncbi:hypothetical protein E6P09_09360 [Haloferax mediterranei ATCC 33500]|uniref:Uncharacterized protein n=1 Tax=Haloferax mediterranei (strain ATCC 33500 / DSM 1411 / JCM 8866 / NBRC 14739 / NCIMB 2177 / R-4) TaxID=523841 RepID=I3R424_HALMT|nr:hypothetical protein [Haloferax mediterranei]AFK18984.1 hypothetical protein HFX_1271 [Haloferax mediterranei ATCC 33500]AHZ21656.1 hypothetical protein BM92_02840 [Haloferax mediterranei ATCC 33500]EMA03158.1 hypothetical protein C439_04150 [Haloferax mediterranei ATCC 33500]MDX5989075.1 hypothetical protein [Haloferax mediterranei ATCC 33500]QCQ75464.1 hypothetical protein E6P09_09360 [Haloferax mediterranei ATCC 33500]